MSFNAQPSLCVNDPIAVMNIIIIHLNKTFETENIGFKEGDFLFYGLFDFKYVGLGILNAHSNR